MKNTSVQEVAAQFQLEALAPRTEIWAKTAEQPYPSTPSPDCPSCPTHG